MHRPESSAIIVVHGGAGDRDPDEVSTGSPEGGRLAGVRRACETGAALLRAGASALDAVEAAVRVLEDDPLFNAGTGACLTDDGDVELDASIMEGATLRCGAVAVVRDVRNPVSLARAVMERSPHVFLAGAGASAFARRSGFEPIENALLVTARQRARWEAARRGGPASRTGTVGAAARDAAGHLAAATSTGGRTLKLPGRIGDSALVGCGTYADDALAAVSCTGNGERIIRVTLARRAADLVAGGRSAMAAAQEAVASFGRRTGGEGGLIVVAPTGEAGFAFDTPAMARAWTALDGTVHVAP
jgi:beta-aspartyl-peptidase (threonine type)